MGWEWSCQSCVQPLPQGMGGFGDAVGVFSKEEGNQAGERVAQSGGGYNPCPHTCWAKRCCWGVRKKREVVGVGGGSHSRVCTQAVTQIYPDRHPEHVNRHMGRPCAASLPVVESKPGAKAHASRNTHTRPHTRTVSPRGIFPALPSFPGVLRRKSQRAELER